MMHRYFSLLFVLLALSTCRKDDHDLLPDNLGEDGFSLYWDHEVFNEGGRALRFELYGKKRTEDRYELVFDTEIRNGIIQVTLTDVVNHGRCPQFPMPIIDQGEQGEQQGLCVSRGRFSIPDNLLTAGNYQLRISLDNAMIQATLNVENDHYTMVIPDDSKLETTIKSVYPIPEGLLFGSLVFNGRQHETYAQQFLDAMSSAGYSLATLPDYAYRHMDVNRNGHLARASWEPDAHSISFLYRLDPEFEHAVELAKNQFTQSHQLLTIYLYTSQGDQAMLNSEGIRVFPANN